MPAPVPVLLPLMFSSICFNEYFKMLLFRCSPVGGTEFRFQGEAGVTQSTGCLAAAE